MPLLSVAAAVLLALAISMGLLVKNYREARLGWVRVQGDCRVRLQRVDPSSLQLRPVSEEKAIRGSGSMGLAIGQYRLTFLPLSTDTSFAETDLLLLRAGPENAIEMRVRRFEDAESEPTENGMVPMRGVEHSKRENMVRIDAGDYDCGTGGSERPLIRRQMVPLEAFYIDRTEVSNEEYLAFLRATAEGQGMKDRLESLVNERDLDASVGLEGRSHHPCTPDFWKIVGYDESLKDRPVVGIRLCDAAAYAQWKGKRLPSMFEWEVAARGQAAGAKPRFEYPGGKPPATFTKLIAPELYLRLDQAVDIPTRVRIYRDLGVAVGSVDAAYEIQPELNHMFDNVREITCTVDLENLDGVAKGRAWLDVPADAPFSQPWSFPLNERSFDRGFRCVRSAAAVRAP